MIFREKSQNAEKPEGGLFTLLKRIALSENMKKNRRQLGEKNRIMIHEIKNGQLDKPINFGFDQLLLTRNSKSLH